MKHTIRTLSEVAQTEIAVLLDLVSPDEPLTLYFHLDETANNVKQALAMAKLLQGRDNIIGVATYPVEGADLAAFASCSVRHMRSYVAFTLTSIAYHAQPAKASLIKYISSLDVKTTLFPGDWYRQIASTLTETADRMVKLDEAQFRILEMATSIPFSYYEDAYVEPQFIAPNQALEWGIVSEVIPAE